MYLTNQSVTLCNRSTTWTNLVETCHAAKFPASLRAVTDYTLGNRIGNAAAIGHKTARQANQAMRMRAALPEAEIYSVEIEIESEATQDLPSTQRGTRRHGPAEPSQA